MISSTWGNRAGCGALTCSLVVDGDRCLKGEWGYVTGIWKRLTMRAKEKKQDRPNRNETKSGKIKLNHR
jgi:hypothetical protein